MPTIVPLDAIPNQSVTIQLDGRRYELRVQEIGGMMAVTVTRDGVRLLSGSRAAAGTPVLQYPHLWAGVGDFIFTNTDEGVAPYYTDFGVSCFLVFSTAAEIARAVGDV